MLHGRRFGELDLKGETVDLRRVGGSEHVYRAEDLAELNRILGQQYHVVMGNPPYITVKDSALNQTYRNRYSTCHRQYSLAVPSDIEGPLTAEAQRRGTTPKLLALDSLRKLFASHPVLGEPPGDATTVFDFLDGYIGTVEGSTEAFSENCGQRFAEGMAEKQQRGRL